MGKWYLTYCLRENVDKDQEGLNEWISLNQAGLCLITRMVRQKVSEYIEHS